MLQRRNRRVPLARLQSVDVVRPLLARALGLAELRLEVAGGGDTEAPLAYLSEDDAHRLRAPPARPRRGVAGPPGAAEPDEPVLVRCPTGALVTSVLLGGARGRHRGCCCSRPRARRGARAAGAARRCSPASAPVAARHRRPASCRRLLAEYGFTVAESPDGLRLRHGLLETRAQTIPLGRVQTVRVREPLLWRRRGWVRVEVDVAGYAGGQRRASRTTTRALLPVAPRAFALALAERVLGAPLPTGAVRAPRARPAARPAVGPPARASRSTSGTWSPPPAC